MRVWLGDSRGVSSASELKDWAYLAGSCLCLRKREHVVSTEATYPRNLLCH